LNFVYKFRWFPLVISCITIIVGFYFSFIKAGIPYQDPTPELTKRYTFYMNLGDTILLIGFIALLVSISLWIIIAQLKKRKSH